MAFWGHMGVGGWGSTPISFLMTLSQNYINTDMVDSHLSQCFGAALISARGDINTGSSVATFVLVCRVKDSENYSAAINNIVNTE